MPVEIKKLVIQAKVADPAPAPVPGVQQAGGTLSPEETQQIVAACVKQVLKVLQREKGR